MKNNKTLYGIIGVVILIVVNLILFLSLKDLSTARWINIIGLNLAIIIFWGASIITGSKETHFMQYSKFPIIIAYTAVTLIISAIFIFINLPSTTISIIVQVLLLAVFIIAMSINQMANNDSVEMAKKDNIKKDDIKSIAKELEIIMKTVDNRDLYKKLETAYDAINNAKINIHNDATLIDKEIMQSINEIEKHISTNNDSEIENEVSKIKKLILQRNEL